MTDEYSYDPYGKIISHTGSTTENPYQYVGALGYYTHWQDPELGLLQLGFRFYDSETGRFTQQDPIGDGLNWYGYASGNPAGLVDPWGLATYIDLPKFLAAWRCGTQDEPLVIPASGIGHGVWDVSVTSFPAVEAAMIHGGMTPRTLEFHDARRNYTMPPYNGDAGIFGRVIIHLRGVLYVKWDRWEFQGYMWVTDNYGFDTPNDSSVINFAVQILADIQTNGGGHPYDIITTEKWKRERWETPAFTRPCPCP